MKKTRLISSAVVLLFAFSLFPGCASYERQVVPLKPPSAYPNVTALAGGTVAAKSFSDTEEARAAFGFDIIGAGVMPVQVVFDNRGPHPLTIEPDQTFMADSQGNLWPILDRSLAYERISKKTDLGKVAPEAAKYGALAGVAGGLLGAAIGVVSGKNVGNAALMGAALGAAVGAVGGGVKGLSSDETKMQIGQDLDKKTLESRTINPGDVGHGFLFFPAEAATSKELRLRVKERDTGALHTIIMGL